MVHDARAIMAAANNADLYQAVFASGGVRYERLPFALVAMDSPPPYYSNLTVLAPGCVPEVTARLRVLADRFGGGIGFKDSFCEFDLRENGFEVLFEASWLWRAPAASAPATDWSKVETPRDLARWEDAWKRAGSPTQVRMFGDAMLRRPEISFLGKATADGFEAGCIANVSTDCIGLSNLFALPSAGDVVAEATAAIAALNCDLPIVGYESGTALAAAKRAGFAATGRLRIHVASQAAFP